MKRLYIILFFVLLSIIACEKERCWECTTHYEVVGQWQMTGETIPISGFPRITDSIYVLCDVSEENIRAIEDMGTKDTFWIRFGDMYLQTSMITKCE